MKATTTRRTFLRKTLASSAALAMPSIIPSRVLGLDGSSVPSDTISLGVIGIGPRCRKVLTGMMAHKDMRCLAIADVQASRRMEGKKIVDDTYGNNDCQLHMDFRELLGRKDIDAVLIATGDRWHAKASMMAAEAGKDVYSEKPCGITIKDCQDLADTMYTYGRIFQAGTQRRSITNFQWAVDLAHSGKLGKIHTLHASIYRPKLNNNWLPAQATPSKEEVDWNMWLGPAPWRPYHPDYCKGRWRGIFDFDSGATLLDWGAHTVDLCQWANQSDDTMPLEYEPGKDTITATYANGVKLVLHMLDTPFGERPGWFQHLSTCPVRFVGEEGWVEVGDSGGIEVSSEALKKAVKDMPRNVSGLGVGEHSRNFFDCIKSRQATAANPTVMRHSHIACHAAAIAWMLGRKISLDPKTETIVNDFEANSLASRPSRKWW
ncbi:MAG: Gfo/Idh/MocA family oxidoreductase [Bacteroidota bacterium]